jgi:hypothetical protein
MGKEALPVARYAHSKGAVVMSYLDTTAKLQDRILDLVTGSEDKVLNVVKTVVDKAEPATSKLPRRSRPEQMPSAAQVIDNTFGFGDRFLASQKSFAHELVDVFAKPSKAPAGRTKKTTPTKVA